jgi:hypothetical protein
MGEVVIFPKLKQGGFTYIHDVDGSYMGIECELAKGKTISIDNDDGFSIALYDNIENRVLGFSDIPEDALAEYFVNIVEIYIWIK